MWLKLFFFIIIYLKNKIFCGLHSNNINTVITLFTELFYYYRCIDFKHLSDILSYSFMQFHSV